jgi:hypothetical protein
MEFEEQYRDSLQKMEAIFVFAYRKKTIGTDYSVMRILESMIDTYTAAKIGRNPRDFSLSNQETTVFNDLKGICEWRRGIKISGLDDLKKQPLAIDDIILCLKQITRSVQKWNKRGGKNGYLEFINPYFPQ